jgi:hypothetical protein
MVLKLRKALNRLRQAPHAWNSKLDSSLVELGFERSPLEHAVYRRAKENTFLLVGVYVDDLIITVSRTADIIEFKEQMMNTYSMSDLGLLTYYLGIEVNQTDEAITLCQSSYARKIVESAGMECCNPCQTPMENRLKLTKNDGSGAVDPTSYRSIVGSLRYLMNTRPDIGYAVGIVSRYMEAPSVLHMAAVKHILRYVSSTTGHGCRYERHGSSVPKMVGYTDSDHAGDADDRKSTSGMAFFFGSSCVTWASQKQKVVALSSCEAEYVYRGSKSRMSRCLAQPADRRTQRQSAHGGEASHRQQICDRVVQESCAPRYRSCGMPCYMEAPSVMHMAAVKHILRYVSRKVGHGCRYERHGSSVPKLVGYTDSDHASDADDRKSTSGMAFFFGSSCVTWASQKQKVVALSSCEAEYIVAATAACQGVWLSRSKNSAAGRPWR